MHESEGEGHRSAQSRRPLPPVEQREVAGREERESREGGARHDAAAPGRERGEHEQTPRRSDRDDAPTTRQQPGVLCGHERDGESDQRLHGGGLRSHPAEHRESERNAVGDGERGDEPGDLSEAARQQQQGQHEGQVVEARQDVLDAEQDVAAQGGAPGLARRSLRDIGTGQCPDRLPLDQHALESAVLLPRDPREVHVRRRLGQQDAALDPGRATRRAVDPPLKVGPALRRTPGDRRFGNRTELAADAEREVTREVARRAAAAAHVQDGIEA